MYRKIFRDIRSFLDAHTTGNPDQLPKTEILYGNNRRQSVYLRVTRRYFENENATFATVELGNISNFDCKESGGRQSLYLSVLRTLEEYTRYITYVENVQDPRLKQLMPRLGYTPLIINEAIHDFELASPTFYKINGPKENLIVFRKAI